MSDDGSIGKRTMREGWSPRGDETLGHVDELCVVELLLVEAPDEDAGRVHWGFVGAPLVDAYAFRDHVPSPERADVSQGSRGQAPHVAGQLDALLARQVQQAPVDHGSVLWEFDDHVRLKAHQQVDVVRKVVIHVLDVHVPKR